MGRAAIFTRVSTDRQTTENQLQRLREVAQPAGWDVVEVYEETVSGATARERRPAAQGEAWFPRLAVGDKSPLAMIALLPCKA
jgi:resolvase-like protein